MQQIKSLLQTKGVDCRILIGGSRARGENYTTSDIDCYLLTGLLGWREILSYKPQLQRLKQRFATEIDFIVLPELLVKYKFYYCFGFKPQGDFIEYPIDYKLQRNNILKSAYSARGKIIFEEKEESWYYFNKSLQNCLWALLLSREIKVKPQDIFSRDKILKSVEKIDLGSINLDRVRKLLKNTQDPRSEQIIILDQLLEQAWLEFLQDSLSLRSWLLYQFFYLPQGCSWQLFFPDKTVLSLFRRSIEHKDKDKFFLADSRKFCIPII